MPTLRGYARTRRAVIGSVMIVMMFAWGLAGSWLWWDYRQTLSMARRELARLSIAAADQTFRVLSLTDVFLDSLEQIIALTDGETDTLYGPAVTQQVTRLLDHVGGVLDVAVVDQANRSLILPYSTGRRLVPVGDRDYVRDAKVGRVTVSAPVQGRSSGEWFIPVSLRMPDPSNRIAVLLAAIHIPALERLFEGIRHSQGYAVALARTDGIVLARVPTVEGAIGKSLAGGYVFRERLPLAPEGPYMAASPVDGQERMGVYRSIDPYDMVILVSQTMTEILVPWRLHVWLSVGVMSAFTLVVSIAAALLLRLISTLENGAILLDRRVTERTAELHRLMEARSDFLTAISHELRTPLNAIIGFSDAILSQLHGPVPPRQSEYVGDIHRSGRHLLALVNDLLDSAAVDAGQLRLDDDDFDLAAMVAEAVAMARPRAEATGITLAATIEPRGLRLRADRRRLMQAILNLCTNAIKYNRQDGRVAISSRIDPDDGSCAIVVADTGIGMSAEDLATALTPFGRVGGRSSAGVTEGTGLGLPLTARIVELHGGRLTFDSNPGQGTTATITLPPSRVRAPSEGTNSAWSEEVDA